MKLEPGETFTPIGTAGMNNNEFWVAIWKIAAIVVIVLAACIASCSAHQTRVVAESDDPIATACALAPSTAGASCLVVAARGDTK